MKQEQITNLFSRMLTLRHLFFALLVISALVISSIITFNIRQQDANSSPVILTSETDLLTKSLSVNTDESYSDDWRGRLYAPTYVKKLNDKWFIVDCWHNRVIWSDDLFKPIAQWNTLDGDLAGPHSIEYAEGYYVVEDTNRHAVNFYTFNSESNNFSKIQSLELGARPHRIHYVGTNNSFYVLSSESQDMHRIQMKNGQATIVDVQKLGFLEGQYTRSFTIVGNEMLFVSGPKKVIKTTYLGDSYNVTASYNVPEDFNGMNDIYYTGKKYILTATLPNAITIVDSLEQIPNAKNQAENLGFKGRPYYVSKVGNALIIPEIAEFASIKLFSVSANGDINPYTTIHKFGEANDASKSEAFRIPRESYQN